MALITILRGLSLLRVLLGITFLVAPIQLCSVFGIKVRGSAIIIIHLLAAREVAFGFILYPKRFTELDTEDDRSTPASDLEKAQLHEVDQLNRRYQTTRAVLPALRMTFIADSIDVLACLGGWVAGNVSSYTAVSLGGIGVASVVITLFCIGMIDRLVW